MEYAGLGVRTIDRNGVEFFRQLGAVPRQMPVGVAETDTASIRSAGRRLEWVCAYTQIVLFTAQSVYGSAM